MYATRLRNGATPLPKDLDRACRQYFSSLEILATAEGPYAQRGDETQAEHVARLLADATLPPRLAAACRHLVAVTFSPLAVFELYAGSGDFPRLDDETPTAYATRLRNGAMPLPEDLDRACRHPMYNMTPEQRDAPAKAQQKILATKSDNFWAAVKKKERATKGQNKRDVPQSQKDNEARLQRRVRVVKQLMPKKKPLPLEAMFEILKKCCDLDSKTEKPNLALAWAVTSTYSKTTGPGRRQLTWKLEQPTADALRDKIGLPRDGGLIWIGYEGETDGSGERGMYRATVRGNEVYGADANWGVDEAPQPFSVADDDWELCDEPPAKRAKKGKE